MKVSRCCVAMSPPSFTAIQKVCLQTDFWLLPWMQMHVRLYRPKIVLGTTLQASNTSLLINPPRNPEYWYSTLKSGSMWMRLSELYFLHVQYNFKQSPLCESCQGPEWWQGLLISLVCSWIYIFFNNMSRFFLSFFLSFLFFFLLIYHKTLFDKVTGVGYRTIFVIYVIQPAKSINFLIYIFNCMLFWSLFKLLSLLPCHLKLTFQ